MASWRDEVLEVARGIVSAGPPLRLAILFGSAAREESTERSDVDLAIWPKDPDLSLAGELALQSDLELALGRTVDLVRLDRASTLVSWEVARAGVPVVSDPPEEFARWVARAASEHADIAPALREAARSYRRALLAAHPSRPVDGR